VHIDVETKVFGLIGYPLSHSLSPLMHNQAFTVAGINAVYLPFPVHPNQFSSVVDAAKTLKIPGFNVTIPYKEMIIPYLDEIDQEAGRCGSVNLVIIEDGRALGFNTDGVGFLDALRQEGHVPSGLAIILGAGGAARALGYTLAINGMETVFVNRSLPRARLLAQEIMSLTGQESQAMEYGGGKVHEYLDRAKLVVNTTPLGMFPDNSLMPDIDLRGADSGTIICDIIYNPMNTRLLQEARSLGLRTMDGTGMFVNQGVRSWEMMVGKKAPRQEMYDVVQKRLLED